MYVSTPSLNDDDDDNARLRILYMPAIYAIISFFSYRFFRSYTYYSLVEIGAPPSPSSSRRI